MDDVKGDVLKRLRRIEGQVKGIQRMVEGGQTCNDILIQIAAIRAAINKVGGIILENYSKECIIKSAQNDFKDNNIDSMIETILKFMK